MAAPCQPCGTGLRRCHLRRIGSRASLSDVADVIHFWKTVTLIGRNRDVVDYFLSCGTPRRSGYISRIHARVIRTSTYELVDSSLTGVYVNDVRICGRVSLQEGDTVTFGHPDWQRVTLGDWARQPNSPFYFLFEHCHCSLDQVQRPPGEVLVLAAAEASPEVSVGLGSEKKVALPQGARAIPGLLPTCPALPDRNVHRGGCHPAAFSALTLPLSSAASVQPPVASLSSTGSVDSSSSLLDVPGDPRLGALPDSARRGSVRSASKLRRSLSPEYAVLEEEMPGATEPSSQGALETRCGSLIQEGPVLICSDPTSGSEELPAGGTPPESCSSEAGTCPLRAACCDRTPSSRPASACLDDSVAADLSHGQCGFQISPAELPRDVPQSACSFQTEQGDGPESALSPLGTKEWASGGSDPHQETMEMEIDESTEGTAKSDPAGLSGPGAPEQVPEGLEEAVSGGQVTSAGCSGDPGPGEDGAVEGDGEILTEKPFPEAGLQEAEWAAAERVTGNSLTNSADPLVPETLALLSGNSGSRTPGALLCGREPAGVLPASLGTATEVDPKAPSTAGPREAQGGRDACEANAQASASEEEGGVEMSPLRDTRMFAAGGPLGPRDAGSVEDPEVEGGAADDASVAELSFAEAGTQTGGTEEREETGPGMAEAGEEREASGVLALLQLHDPGIDTHVAKETLLQPSSAASASGFPAREVHSQGEFSREGTVAAASSGAMQENSSSEDLTETCKGETLQADAAPPAGLVLGEGTVLAEPLEADLREQPMDLDGSCSGECLSQGSETCSEGDQEGVAAGRELERGRSRGTEPDPAAEGQLAACRLGDEEGRCEEDGVPPSPACTSPAASPGGKEPDSLCDESKGQEEVAHDGASGGGKLGAQRGGSVVASAFPAAVGEGQLENQPEGLLGQPSVALQGSCGSAGSALARSPEGDVACSSAALARDHAVPPAQLPSDALGEGEGIPPVEDSCVGTQLLIQRSEKGAGGRLESEESRLLPKQDGTEEEQEAGLSNEVQVTSQSCSVGTKPLENAQQPHEMAEPKQKSSQVERWTDRLEGHGMSSAPPTQLGCQADSPLPPDCQGPGWDAGEPQGPEPQGTSAGKGSLPPGGLPVEGSTWEEACQADAAAECSTPPGPEGRSEGVVVPAQGDASQQSPEGSSSGEEMGKVSLGLCAAGPGRSGALRESPATSLPRLDSVVVPESSSSDELNLRISDSEAEREENDDSQAHGASGREAVDLEERDALISASAEEHLDGAPEDSEAGSKQTERRATQGQDEAANPETGGGLSRAADALAPQTSSCYKACGNLSRAALAVPETSITDMAAGGRSPAFVKAAAAREEPEAPAGEGTELMPLNLSCVPEEDPCLLESEDQGQEGEDQGVEDQAPGSTSGTTEEVGSDLPEDGGRLESRFARQPGGETLEVGEAPEGRLQGEIPADVCAEKADCNPKTKERAATLRLQQEMETWQPQGSSSPSEDDPGCRKWLENPERGRIPFPKEEESGGCSSRKRHFSQDQAPGMVDSEHNSSRRKRLCLLDSGSGLPPSTSLPSAPRDRERHRDQFSRTIGRFLQQYSSRVTLPSDETEEKNRDSIAQIVRSYFHSTFGPAEPEAEDLEAEASALPLEGRVSGDGDWKTAAGSEAERSPAGEETESSLTLSAEPQVPPVPCQDPSLRRECPSPGSPSCSSISCSQQLGQELLAHRSPETAWDAYFSEEEEFQSSISSVLEHSLLSSPVASPEARCGQEPCRKSAGLVFSDISNSWAESEHCGPPPEPGHGSSRGMEWGQLHGMQLPEAAVVDLASGGARHSPGPAGVGWCKEETSPPSGMPVSSHEHPPIPEAASPVEPGDHLDAAGGNTGTPVLQQAGGTFDGEGDRAAPGKEASDWVTSGASCPLGEAGEELDNGASRMQTEDGVFLQRGLEDSPPHELECKPAIRQPPDSALWDPRAPSVKAEPAPGHVGELADEDGSASPSRTALVTVTSASTGCPTAADPRGGDSILQGSSASPPPGQARARSQDQSSSSLNGPCLPRSVKQDGGAETADAGAGRRLPSGEEGSSLCPLPPFGPAGIADGPEERGFGGGLERDLGRSGAKWPGQTDTSGAPQGDAGGTGRSAGPSLTVGVGGSRVPACSPWVQEDAPVLIRMPSLSSSRLIKEEPDPCDSHVPVAGSIPCGGYPTARSPVIPVLQKPGIPEASANWVPESPEGCATEEWRLDEAEAPGQLDTASTQSGDEHAPCTEAEEGRSSALAVSPRVSEPPPRRSPWTCEGGSAQEDTSASSAVGADSSPRRPWASSEQEIAFQLQECQSVLEEISRSLCAVEGIDHLHMEKWREQIAELQKATKPPSTYIAVVGNTGAGKSSLLNALLDEEAVLPTSAMRACTAVVVEVSRGAGGRPYEAEVEFLSQEEWYKELTALLEDMKDKSGNLKKRYPDRKTEAGAAYSRVKAVYGMVGELAKLKSMQDVTQHLGTVKRISAETAADFRAQIEKFIDSRTDSLRDMKGGEFWPIVKCVKIRVGRAEALKTGVVLVDLPGIRDSNAARDNAAKEYLKNCNAVWVVASITRAVDDKTAREILNSNLRRQLFMDGLYGNLAFICTKTDSFNISDIVRDLDLRGEIQPLEEELEELEGQRMQAEEEKRTLHMALHLERPGVEAADPAWLQKEFQLSALQKQKEAKLRAISLICVQARNKFSKQQIRMDFNTGLEELKRKAEFSECDEDGDEDMGDGDFASSDLGDLGGDESQREKLHVFTVSSTEYLKLSRKLLRDGPAQVFHDPKDTEIPALKDFVIEMGLKTSMKATEKVIRDVARVISQIVHYLTNQRAEDVSHQAQVQEKVQQALQGLPRLLQEATDDVLPDIQYFFEVLIQTSLSRGSNKAKGLCEDIVKSWGLPGSGFPHSTYHAACLRHGVYTSLKCGCVDFNLQLAKPVNDAIAGAWFAIFGTKMEESLERFTKAVLDKLKCFFRELKSDVGRQGNLTEALDALRLQQMEAIQARLRNFLLDQEAYISKKQRSISRMLTPAIQAGMEPAYAACSQMSGPGYFQRMKDMMEHYVRENKDFIFEAAAKKLEEQLNRLQQRIRGSFQSLVLELNKALRMQFEPLLQPVQKKAEIIPDLMNICAKVDKICKRSCVAYALPSASQEEAGSPEPVPLCLSALHLDVRLGALPLPCIVAIQVSGRQDLALRLADESAVALPLGSVALCESCLPLGCLILHLSAESAGEIRRRCRVRASSPGQHGREVLVILDKAPDQALFSRLVASVLSSRRDASWVQTLSLCQGRERLESLGVYRTPRQAACEAEPLPPQVVSVMQQPLVNLLPYGRKRAGEAGPAPLEKRHKSQAGADHAGHPLPSWSPEGQAGPCGGRAASCPLPARGGCFPEDCRRKTAASEPLARPGSAGAPVRAEEGFRGRGCDPDPKGDRGKKTLKALPPVESGEEASLAVGSRLFQ